MTKQNIIKLNKKVKEKITEIEGGTFDTKVNTLMDIVDPFMPFVPYSNERGSVKIKKETLKKLDSYRITTTETRDNILTRMLIMLDELNNTTTSESTEFIPFKLINPYNNLLVIDGQVEYNSKSVSFNYRDNLYFGKLPSSYVVEGKDLTKELYIWYDNLNWTEIIDTILENHDTQTIIDEKDYSLEINQPLM